MAIDKERRRRRRAVVWCNELEPASCGVAFMALDAGMEDHIEEAVLVLSASGCPG